MKVSLERGSGMFKKSVMIFFLEQLVVIIQPWPENLDQGFIKIWYEERSKLQESQVL